MPYIKLQHKRSIFGKKNKNDSYNGFTGRRAAQSWRWSLHRPTVKHTSRLLTSHIYNTHLETNSIKGSLEVVAWIQQASIVCFPKISKSWKLFFFLKKEEFPFHRLQNSFITIKSKSSAFVMLIGFKAEVK